MGTDAAAHRTSIELADAEDAGIDDSASAVAPVSFVPGDAEQQPAEGIGLCLSGGGSRAMVFHIGALYRLNETGILRHANRISGVSGGSIIGAVLGLGWRNLRWDERGVASNLEAVLKPIERFAAKSIDVHAVLEGVIRPDQNAADRLDHELDRHLYKGATLQDLPGDTDDGGSPRFIFNATNLSSSALWRFSKPYTWDWRVGKIPNPTFRVSTAVAASAAFPPFFAPLELDVDPAMFEKGTGRGLERPEYQRRIRLADGGVYDNLGLETIFKKYRTIFASDGGGQVADDPSPATDWIRETLRMTSVIDHQVRSLRKRLLIAAYKRKGPSGRKGAYWGIRQQLKPGGPLDCPGEATMALANLPTRLDGMTDETRDRLINWGYAAAEAAIRQWYGVSDPEPRFPRPGGVG